MTFYVVPYDPNAPKPIHHWEMQLSTECILVPLTFATLVGRTAYRWNRLKRFRKEDGWIVGAALSLIGLFVSELGVSMTGSGLYVYNAPDSWLEAHWIFNWFYAFYYSVISCIKIALCCCLLEFLPHHFKTMRRLVIALCFFISALGIAISFTWIFQCQPFAANFNWNVDEISCIDIDYSRYVWYGLSIPIDLAILSIPFLVIRRTGLQLHEKRVLKLVFCANLLGTMACCAGVYGTWENREDAQLDGYYTETAMIMIWDFEILCYAVGVTLPVFSRFFIAKSAPSQVSPSQGPKPSWLRTVTTSFTNTFTTTSPSTQSDSPKGATKSRRSTFPHPHPNLLPISELSNTSEYSKNESPISGGDFITVPQKYRKDSTTTSSHREVVNDDEITAHTSLPMVTPNGVNSSIITPIYMSRSTSTRSWERDFVDDERVYESVMSDLEGGYGYHAWVEGGGKKRDSGVVAGNKHNLRTSALYEF